MDSRSPSGATQEGEIEAVRTRGKRIGRIETHIKGEEGEEGQRGEAFIIVTETESRAGQRGARAQKVSGRGSARGGFVEGAPVSLR